MPKSEQLKQTNKQLPPPWDRIFYLGSRLFVWSLLFTILYILRPFFLLIFMTFVVAYILEHGVQGLQHRIPKRAVRVVLVSAVFLTTLVTVVVALAPSFKAQATKLASDYPIYLKSIDKEVEATREKYAWAKSVLPEDVHAADLIEYLLGFIQTDRSSRPTGPPVVLHRPGAYREKDETGGDGSAVPVVLPDPAAGAGSPPRPSTQNLAAAVEKLANIASPILGIGSAFLLALLFSFLIVLDLPKLSRAVAGLTNTRIGFFYDEVAGNVLDFGKMLGRALEAQLFIAVCNTVLTAIGLYFLGLTTNLVFLSTIVFFCSFIPVAGVFLSSTPICLEALSVSGVQLLVLAIGLILIIHIIEAYFLNPKIFGHHLHMNPVLVLIVLTIGGKLFGVWGLILGLPVVNYLFGHAIRFAKDDPPKAQSAAA